MQVARVGKRCQDAEERQSLGVLGATRGRSSESARLAVQQAVQQVGATIWSWRVARAGADYKIVDRAAEGGLQLGRVFCVCK